LTAKVIINDCKCDKEPSNKKNYKGKFCNEKTVPAFETKFKKFFEDSSL